MYIDAMTHVTALVRSKGIIIRATIHHNRLDRQTMDARTSVLNGFAGPIALCLPKFFFGGGDRSESFTKVESHTERMQELHIRQMPNTSVTLPLSVALVSGRIFTAHHVCIIYQVWKLDMCKQIYMQSSLQIAIP